jgi:tRNA modification GTPase
VTRRVTGALGPSSLRYNLAVNLDDTIVAIATPPGRGGIGVVRVAGPEAMAIVRPMLALHRDLEPGRAIFTELIEPEADADASRIDEVVVTYFAKPHSYTADDVIEISAHGSPVVLRHIVELALARGARLAEPGEFTMRAFLNGRIDLAQAEAVRDLIEAQTLFQAKVAAQQLDGALSKRLKPIKQRLVDLIARLEAGIDFAEDDVSVLPDAVILEQIDEVRGPLQALESTFSYGKVVHEGLTLAIVGRPNVGKSSLFNRLVERERAIVTATPGTTRDLVTETVAIGGIPIKLVDTAGIRHASDEAESLGIQKSIEALADADLVLRVIDVSQPESSEDEQLAQQTAGRPTLVVGNKADLASGDRISTYSRNTIRTSAITGDGIPELRAAILRHVGGESGATVESGFLTSARHRSLVQQCLDALAAACGAVRNKTPHEMVLLDLYSALRFLDEITGATTNDDILNLIFSTFCIGK